MSEKEVRALLRKAERSVQSARRLLDDGDADFAMSRAYYAMFYAARAALLCRGTTRSKHSGVIAAFGETLVKTGDFTAGHQRPCARPSMRGAKPTTVTRCLPAPM